MADLDRAKDRESAVLRVFDVLDDLTPPEELDRIRIGPYAESVKPPGWWWEVTTRTARTDRSPGFEGRTLRATRSDPAIRSAKAALIAGHNQWPKTGEPAGPAESEG